VGTTGFAGALALLAGVAGAVQVAVMGRFGERIGSLEALAFSTVLTALVAAGVLLVLRRTLDGFAEAVASPKWMWLGALMGVVIVLSITVVAPRIGVVATTGLLIVGQLATATLVDRLGLFGVERIGITATKVIGLVLLAAGAALTLRR
jgi:transporter family-2 protein